MSFHVLRDMIQMGTGSAASPDLDGGRYFDGGHHGYIDLGYDYHGERFPYSVVMYGIVGQAERLVRTETTVYHDGDSMTTVQSTAYRGGTGLPERITTACGDRSRTVEVAYPEASRGGVEAAMVSSGAVGVPLRGVTTTEAEYEHLSGRLFRTARTRRWHTGMADTLVSPRYFYNDLGQLAGLTDGDGVPTAFLWGYGSTLPVWQIRGSTYAEAVRRHGGTGAGVVGVGAVHPGAVPSPGGRGVAHLGVGEHRGLRLRRGRAPVVVGHASGHLGHVLLPREPRRLQPCPLRAVADGGGAKAHRHRPLRRARAPGGAARAQGRCGVEGVGAPRHRHSRRQQGLGGVVLPPARGRRLGRHKPRRRPSCGHGVGDALGRRRRPRGVRVRRLGGAPAAAARGLRRRLSGHPLCLRPLGAPAVDTAAGDR